MLITLVLVGSLWLLWRGPWELDRVELNGLRDSGPKATVVAGFRTAVVALLVASAGAVGLFFTGRTLRVTQENLRVAQETLQHNREKDQRQEGSLARTR